MSFRQRLQLLEERTVQEDVIDITPTWSALVPAFVTLITQLPKGHDDRSFVITELFRMAHAADLYNKAAKEQRPVVPLEETPHMERML